MPWIEDEKQQQFLSREIGVNIEDTSEVEWKEQLRAAYRMENTIGSFFARESNLPDSYNSGDYSAWDDLTDQEQADSDFLDNAVYADSPEELDALRKQRARELKDKETLSRSSFISTFAVAAADPINLIPVGGATYKTYRTGSSILTGAAATARAAVVGAGVSEAALHHSQITRTYGESGVNMAAAALFGSVLGATPGAVRKLISGSEDDIAKVFDPEARIKNGENSAMSDGSLSAASVDFDPVVRGKVARLAGKLLAFDPLSRTTLSDVKATRQTANRLAENFLDIDTPGGMSVETKIKLHDGKLYEAISQKNVIYKDYKANGGQLSPRAFDEEVGKAMRNGSDDPHIKKATQAFRSSVYDPIKKEAIGVKFLPEDVDVTTAENYLNRVWNKEKITKEMPLFVKKVSKWLMDQDEARAGRKADELDQDFKVKIQEEVRVKETGEITKVEADADTLWRQTKKRKSLTQTLRDCLNA